MSADAVTETEQRSTDAEERPREDLEDDESPTRAEVGDQAGAPADVDTTEYTLRIFRGDDDQGEFVDYDVPVQEGMVVLDGIHWVQANVDPELAVRWNCKSGRCGSCGMEIDGMPKLACMDRFADYDPDEPITVTPMQTFPVIKDLVPDVSWNYRVNKGIEPFDPGDNDEFQHQQEDIERPREFRRCIECFLCQDVCHVLREHDQKDEYAGPRYLVRSAALQYHPQDTADRTAWMKQDAGVERCNVTNCCTDVCPEDIQITENAIIPQRERVVDEYYDPLKWVARKLRGD